MDHPHSGSKRPVTLHTSTSQPQKRVKQADEGGGGVTQSSMLNADTSIGPTLACGLGTWAPPQWRLGESPEKLRALLEQDPGVVVVPGAVPVAACDDFTRDLRTVLEACNGHWHLHHAPRSNGNGLLKHYGVAASPPCQRLRCHKNVQRVYEALYGAKRGSLA